MKANKNKGKLPRNVLLEVLSVLLWKFVGNLWYYLCLARGRILHTFFYSRCKLSLFIFAHFRSTGSKLHFCFQEKGEKAFNNSTFHVEYLSIRVNFFSFYYQITIFYANICKFMSLLLVKCVSSYRDEKKSERFSSSSGKKQNVCSPWSTIDDVLHTILWHNYRAFPEASKLLKQKTFSLEIKLRRFLVSSKLGKVKSGEERKNFEHKKFCKITSGR